MFEHDIVVTSLSIHKVEIERISEFNKIQDEQRWFSSMTHCFHITLIACDFHSWEALF